MNATESDFSVVQFCVLGGSNECQPSRVTIQIKLALDETG